MLSYAENRTSLLLEDGIPVYFGKLQPGQRIGASVKARTPAKPAAERYDRLTRSLHWIFALGIMYILIVGYALRWIESEPLRDFLAHLNMSLASLLIPLFPVRLIWKLLRTNPAPLPLPAKQLKIAHTVHNLLYLLISVVLASGFLMVPHGYMIFGIFPMPTPFEKGPVTEFCMLVHTVSNAILAGLIMLHMMGVVHNVLFKRINIVRRMV